MEAQKITLITAVGTAEFADESRQSIYLDLGKNYGSEAIHKFRIRSDGTIFSVDSQGNEWEMERIKLKEVLN